MRFLRPRRKAQPSGGCCKLESVGEGGRERHAQTTAWRKPRQSLTQAPQPRLSYKSIQVTQSTRGHLRFQLVGFLIHPALERGDFCRPPHSSLPSRPQSANTPSPPRLHMSTLICIFQLLTTLTDTTSKFCTGGNTFLPLLPTHTHKHTHAPMHTPKSWLQEIYTSLWKLKNSSERK